MSAYGWAPKDTTALVLNRLSASIEVRNCTLPFMNIYMWMCFLQSPEKLPFVFTKPHRKILSFHFYFHFICYNLFILSFFLSRIPSDTFLASCLKYVFWIFLILLMYVKWLWLMVLNISLYFAAQKISWKNQRKNASK